MTENVPEALHLKTDEDYAIFNRFVFNRRDDLANRVPMDISDRAKQFLPFAALKGLPEALRRAEKEVEKSFEEEKEEAEEQV